MSDKLDDTPNEQENTSKNEKPINMKTHYVVPGPRGTKEIHKDGVVSFQNKYGYDSDTECEEFMIDDLAKSGLTPEDTYSKPRYDVEPIERAAYWLPYFNPNGQVIIHDTDSPTPLHPYMYRIRRIPSDPRVGKYGQPSKEEVGEWAVYPYLNPKMWELEDTSTLLICEGEKKAAAAIKYLKMPAIGIGGCWNWQDPNGSTRQFTIHSAILETINRVKPEKIIIVPDGDVVNNSHVNKAFGTLSYELRRVYPDLEVPVIRLPNDEAKLDDLIVEWGSRARSEFDALQPAEDLSISAASLAMTFGLDYDLTKDGTVIVKPTGYNLWSVIEQAPDWEDIWYDGEKDRAYKGNTPVTDAIIGQCTRRFIYRYSRSFHTDTGMTTLDNLFYKLAFQTEERVRYPWREYLESLEWDGVERLETMFIDYCNAEDSEHSRECGRKFLVASARRVFQPGADFQYMLIFCGPQACGKSTFPRKLWGEENVTDFLNVEGKDRYLIFNSNFLISWEELMGMSKRDVNHLKGEISSNVDSVRAPYGRVTKETPRRCTFFGSVNDTEFLQHDPTGQRRYAVLKVDNIDLEGVEAVRDQLWAEAVAKIKDTPDCGIITTASEVAREHEYRDTAWYDKLIDRLTVKYNQAKKYDSIESGLPIGTYKGEEFYAFSVTELMDIANNDHNDPKSDNKHYVAGRRRELERNGWKYLGTTPIRLKTGERAKRKVLIPVADLVRMVGDEDDGDED